MKRSIYELEVFQRKKEKYLSLADKIDSQNGYFLEAPFKPSSKKFEPFVIRSLHCNLKSSYFTCTK